MPLCKGTKLSGNILERFNTLYSILKNDFREDASTDICPL